MWPLLALTAALATALRDAASKQAARAADPVLIAYGIALVPALLLGAIALARGPATTGPGFLTALLVAGGINALTTPLIVWSLRVSDMSLVIPLRSLTPLFMLATAAVVLGERPTPTGALGVAVIVAGAYLLNISDRGTSVLEPFRALLRDRGARAMLLVAFLYSISAVYDKVGVEASSAITWGAAVKATVVVLLTPFVVWRWARRSVGPERRGGPKPPGDGSGPGEGGDAARLSLGPVAATLLAGAVISVGLVAQYVALTMTLAAYVIAVKRTSTLFGVLLGASLFRERRTPERLLGAGVMLVGFVLVTLG